MDLSIDLRICQKNDLMKRRRKLVYEFKLLLLKESQSPNSWRFFIISLWIIHRTQRMAILDGRKRDVYVRKPRRQQRSIEKNAKNLMRIISNYEQNISITKKTIHCYQLLNSFSAFSVSSHLSYGSCN